MSSETCCDIVYAQMGLDPRVPYRVMERYEEFAKFVDGETVGFKDVQVELIRESFSDMIAVIKQGYTEKK